MKTKLDFRLVPTFFRFKLLKSTVLFSGLLLVAGPLSADVLFSPVSRPADISAADWERLFRGTPQIITAHLVTTKGVSCYEFRNWDPSPEVRGMGGAATYVQVKDGHVTVPWRFQPFGTIDPPWASLGLTEREAVEMVKQSAEKEIQVVGFENLRDHIRRAYEASAKLPGHSFDIQNYYPESIEAEKELGLLPPDFVPPPLSEKDQHFLKVMLGQEKVKPRFTKEQNDAITRKLGELVRANALGDKKAMDKANRELDEIFHPELFHPKPSEQSAPPAEQR
ncbi:protein of unknown function [Methylacidimicrobium sp. AP8]|uniref:hypothetical protein n=1 Tax=Methylacidimicrobium sp. AP8 TaxID=2730359 RepID=UPI0018C0DD34|nr:hypothetical protein [Methylacidimicrobium sp. AP8]CAB4243607.1 protein of unknown function [Methylacidimicrobium sp. AP8]